MKIVVMRMKLTINHKWSSFTTSKLLKNHKFLKIVIFVRIISTNTIVIERNISEIQNLENLIRTYYKRGKKEKEKNSP